MVTYFSCSFFNNYVFVCTNYTYNYMYNLITSYISHMLFVECAIHSYLWSTSFLKISHVVQTTASRLTRIQTISEKMKSTKQHKCVDKVKPGTYCEHIWYSVECSKKLHMYLPMYATLNSMTAIRGVWESQCYLVEEKKNPTKRYKI